MIARDVDRVALPGIDRNRLECALQHALANHGWRAFGDLDVREHRLLKRGVVMGAHAQADQKRLREMDAERAASAAERLTLGSDRDRDVVALLLDPHPPRSTDVRADLTSQAALCLAVLEGGEAVGVDHRIDVGRIGIKALTDQERGLTVRMAAGADKADVGCQRNVAFGALPDKMEGVGAEPHVFAATADCVCLGLGVVLQGAWFPDRTHVALGFEKSEVGRRSHGHIRHEPSQSEQGRT